MDRDNNLTTSNSGNKSKPFPGSKGDPRMNRAVAARLKDPGMSLLEALRAGGFTWPEGPIDGTAVDSDNVQLVQRKNQLTRRLRCERWRREQQQISSGDPEFNKTKKRRLTSSPPAINAIDYKRRNVTPDPDLDPFASTSSGTRHYHPSSSSPEIVDVNPSAISPVAVNDESAEQVQVVPPQQWRPLSPRPPTPIPLTAISRDGQQTPWTEVRPGNYSATSAADGDKVTAVRAEDDGASGFNQDDVNEEGAKRFLLKTCTIDIESHPLFTDEERQEEERGLPPEERAAVLADLRGKHPTDTGTGTGTGTGTLTNAVRRSSLLDKSLAIGGATQANLPSLVPLSIRALLQAMREHVSVLQQRGSCPPEVDAAISWDLSQSWSNSDRLKLFLRREEMDAKLAAVRFVKYWTKRYELFGRDKFRLPMTLNGAMRDDVRALETGSFRLMPKPDLSGRRILFKASCFNNNYGYASDSMVRVCWYMLELLLEDPVTAREGFVLVSWDRETSLWNYDRKIGSSFAELEGECLPIRFAAVHVCNCTNLIINLIKPIVFGFVERRVRNRILWHRESDEELFDKLRGCGITQDMLPVEMGGTSQFSHLSWLRERMEVGK